MENTQPNGWNALCDQVDFYTQMHTQFVMEAFYARIVIVMFSEAASG